MKEDYTWFDKPENKGNIDFPVAMVYSPTTNTWTVACDEDINPYLPEHLFGYGTGKTKEEAIRNMFANINIVINYHTPRNPTAPTPTRNYAPARFHSRFTFPKIGTAES
jgi:hypothetical protein